MVMGNDCIQSLPDLILDLEGAGRTVQRAVRHQPGAHNICSH